MSLCLYSGGQKITSNRKVLVTVIIILLFIKNGRTIMKKYTDLLITDILPTHNDSVVILD